MTASRRDVEGATRRNESILQKIALAYPGAHEDNPWGHRAIKVRKKTFVFLGCNDEGVGMSVKLPTSNLEALDRPNTEPTHYGLGKSGWVSIRIAPGDELPLDVLRAWIDESYRAIAPKKLVAELDGDGAAVTKKKSTKKKSTKKKSTKKKSDRRS